MPRAVGGTQIRVGIQWRSDDNYLRNFCAAVVDSLLNLDHFPKASEASLGVVETDVVV